MYACTSPNSTSVHKLFVKNQQLTKKIGFSKLELLRQMLKSGFVVWAPLSYAICWF